MDNLLRDGGEDRYEVCIPEEAFEQWKDPQRGRKGR